MRSSHDHLAAHVVRMEGAGVVVRAGLVEANRDALASPDLVVVLPIDPDGVREVVVVPPGNRRAGLDLDLRRVEAIALGHRHGVRGDRFAATGGAAAARGDERESGHGEGNRFHERLPWNAGQRTSSGSTAPANTATKAARSSTSLIVCANRKTVQS